VAALESLITGLTFGSMLGWPYLRRLRYERRHRAFVRSLGEDVQVALSVATHEAQARHQTIAPVHLLYGLLQVEAFTAAIERLGGMASAIEERVHAELDGRGQGEGEREIDEQDAAAVALGSASITAKHAGRPAGCADLWAFLIRTDVAKLVEVPPPVALLFVLAHGHLEPSPTLAHAPVVNVVMRNDDYTRMELVVELLRDVFELPEPEAMERMRTAHEQGRAVVGRLPSELARTRIETARARARAQASPLWLGVEPA